MTEVSDPTLIVTNDGEIPFKRPQAGQDPVGDQDFVTKGWAVANLGGASDHGTLSGLGDDDHSQYSLVDGSRAFTAAIEGVAGSTPNSLSTKGYVDFAIGAATSSIIATAYLAFQPLAPNLSGFSSLPPAADQLPYFTTVGGAMAIATFTALGRSIVASSTEALALKVLGSGASATGSGGVVLASSPTLVAPALGTPTALVLTNATGLPTAGHLNDSVTFAKMQNIATDKVLGRSTAGSGDVEEIDCTATGRSLIASASVEAARQTLDVGNNSEHSVWFAHFIQAGAAQNGWTNAGSGTGNGVGQHWDTLITTSQKGIGVIEVKPGTTSTGYHGLFTSNDSCIKGQAKFVFEARLCPLDLSGGGDVYRIHFGITRTQFTATNPNTDHAACLTYDPDSLGNGNWHSVTSNGTATTNNTSVAATADVFQVLRVEMNLAGTEVAFFIDGTPVATHTTNLPTSRIGPMIKIVKISGTNDRPLCIDWTRFSVTL